ncbi:MAG: hypothetical protein U0M00_05160 [Clostridia bacterium]|nr:hypothetical protein [Clostridia bacterium]
MKKIITVITIIIVVIIAFFIKFNYKKIKSGNNISIKSADDVKNYILGISSYEATFKVEINSNKNNNSYLIKEQYIKENGIYKQEVLEPENIKGVTTIYDGSSLKIENSNINLSKIYENYQCLGDNALSLSAFIDDFLDSGENKVTENENEIILETSAKNGNKYINHKRLYIDKKTSKPTKMEVQDITQKNTIYILYNEIKINNLQKEDVLAFKLSPLENDI